MNSDSIIADTFRFGNSLKQKKVQKVIKFYKTDLAEIFSAPNSPPKGSLLFATEADFSKMIREG